MGRHAQRLAAEITLDKSHKKPILFRPVQAGFYTGTIAEAPLLSIARAAAIKKWRRGGVCGILILRRRKEAGRTELFEKQPGCSGGRIVCVCGGCGRAARPGRERRPGRFRTLRKKELFWVALCCLAAGAAAQALLAACALRQAPGQGLAQALEHFFYYNIDARHYIEIAQLGYLPPGTGPEEQHLMIVFFPCFPAAAAFEPDGSHALVFCGDVRAAALYSAGPARLFMPW